MLLTFFSFLCFWFHLCTLRCQHYISYFPHKTRETVDEQSTPSSYVNASRCLVLPYFFMGYSFTYALVCWWWQVLSTSTIPVYWLKLISMKLIKLSSLGTWRSWTTRPWWPQGWHRASRFSRFKWTKRWHRKSWCHRPSRTTWATRNTGWPRTYWTSRRIGTSW